MRVYGRARNHVAGATFVVALGWFVAAAAQTPRRAVSWDRARAEIAKFRTVADNSGLVDVDAYISPHVDAEDLEALCAA